MHLYKTGSLKYLLLISFICSAFLHAESFDRDRVFNEFVSSKTRKINTEDFNNKCNFALQNNVRSNFDRFTDYQKSILKPMLDRPALTNSMVTPSGLFRIHYNISGSMTPVYDLDSLAATMDSVYRFEILYLGYPMPPSDNGAGGDNLYDIYIIDMNYYGETNFEFTSEDKGPSYINIDNDFAGFYTQGINGAKVTLAHEFHHAIQVGSYIFRNSDSWFYEMTSTSMEEFVYNSINDYYNYIRNYFSKPDRSIASNNVASGDGYDIAIWNIYLRLNFDFDIIKRQWELMPGYEAIQAIENSIQERDSLFSSVLNKFGVWCYFTGKKAKTGEYFPEAANYPTLKPQMNQNFTPPSKSYSISAYPAANTYLNVVYLQQNDVDTLTAIITNGDISAFDPAAASAFKYDVFSDTASGSRKIGNKFSITFTPPKPSLWVDAEILNNVLIGTNNFLADNSDFVYPSPFNYKDNTYIYIPVESNNSGSIQLSVFTPGMDLILSTTKIIEKPFGQPIVRWNGKTLNNDRLSSGVYIYVTRSGDKVKKGKLVIFNE